MEYSLFEWIPTNPFLAAFISIGLNILVAITGVLPSAFITVGTVGLFGFKLALLILIIGEAAGAIVSFVLYRKGVHKLLSKPKMNKKEKNFLQKLKNTDGMSAFFIVVLLRIIPFVPSGIVTLTAALSKMGLIAFSIASTLGKIPALVVEAYSVSKVLTLQTEWQVGLILVVVILFLFYLLWKRKQNRIK
jgi:uncharacterized membrane protein YdjX (TVP38/TMEM64 family)